jgi:Dolichyl-phosphate-mannose-protein mannosyltransferase
MGDPGPIAIRRDVPNARLRSQSTTHSQSSWIAASRSTATILAIGLLARILATWEFIAHHPKNWLFSHPYEMGLVANSLVHGLGYSSPFGGSTGPTAIVAPGYPTVIAAILLLFGSFTFASAIAIMTLQILVSLLTIWLMMQVARQMFDSRTAVIAGAFWAISLPLLWIPTIFWETSLSACGLTGMVALALRCLREPSKPAWILLGTCSALTCLVNPALLPSSVAMMGWAAWNTQRGSRTAPVLGLLAFIMVFSAWPIRNAYQFHAFIPLRSTLGMEMYMGNRPGATGRLDDSLFPMINKPEFASYVASGEVAYTNGKLAEACAYIRTQPGIFLKMSLRRAYRFWAGTGNIDGPPIYEIHSLLTTVLGAAGLALLYRRRRTLGVLIAVPLVLFPIPYYLAHAEFRYRLVIDPILTILAAFTVRQLASARSRTAVQELRETIAA